MRPADALPEDVRGVVVKGRHAASAVYLATESAVADDLSRTLLDLCATVERLAADKARLDWLDTQVKWTKWVGYDREGGYTVWPVKGSYRDAIDAAMRAQAQEGVWTSDTKK